MPRIRDDLSSIQEPAARILKPDRAMRGKQTTLERRRRTEMSAIEKETKVTTNDKARASASRRAAMLAERIEEGAALLADFAEGLSDEEWHTPVSNSDRRPVGVIVHHVASVYPVEIELARAIASGKTVTDVTWEVIAGMNAGHARDQTGVTKAAALELLRRNSHEAADAVRAFTDDELDGAAPLSLSYGAPVTAQFVIEDHALRHSWHHLARIRAALGR
jgi:hypothetical protein